jgi:hypothetical protein
MRASIAAKSRRSLILSGACRARFGEIPTSRCSDASMGQFVTAFAGNM